MSPDARAQVRAAIAAKVRAAYRRGHRPACALARAIKWQRRNRSVEVVL